VIFHKIGVEIDDFLATSRKIKGLAPPQLLVMELLRTVFYITSPS